MSMKNSLTPAGIEPATFRFVAQHINHCATAVPTSVSTDVKVQTFIMGNDITYSTIVNTEQM